MDDELLKLTDWFRANRLSLNISQTNICYLQNQKHQPDTNIYLQLSDSNIQYKQPNVQNYWVYILIKS